MVSPVIFKLFPTHDQVQCFMCYAILPGDRWVRSGYAHGRGEFYQRCAQCGVRTWYDLEPPKPGDHNVECRAGTC